MNDYIRLGSKFLEMNRDVSLERLNGLVGKKVFADMYEDDFVGVSNSMFEILEVGPTSMKIKENGNEYDIDIATVRGLDELLNYNDRELDFESYVGKIVRLTDKNGVTETVEVQDVGDDYIFLGFDFEKDDGSVYRSDFYQYPLVFIKDISE